MSEEKIRIEILKQCEGLEAGKCVIFTRNSKQGPLYAEIGEELIDEGLVFGNTSDHGTVMIRGIRDSGKAYILSGKWYFRILAFVVSHAKWVIYAGWWVFGFLSGSEAVQEWVNHLIRSVIGSPP